jgi:hydroxypyruvate isomerase
VTIKFSPNLNIFFRQFPMAERIEKVAGLGFRQVEFWGWWDEDIDALQAAAEASDVAITAFCTKFVSLVDKTRRESYLTGLEETLTVAKRLNCPTIISQVGDELKGVTREEQRASLIEGLAVAAPMLEQAGTTLTIEPLNILVNHPGYYLTRSDEAVDIVRQVDSPKIKVLFDVYHQQITEGNLINNIRSGSEWIGHYHIADNPGRCEIGRGEINYRNVLKAIEETGYQGTVGVELFPKYGSDASALEGLSQLIQ